MSVAASLDQFRESLQGCDLVVLADLATGTVLASSADLAPSQERLDALTAEATASVLGPVGEGACLLLDGDPERPDVAVVSRRAGTHVFATNGAGRTEALLISLQSNEGLGRIFDCAQDVLADILDAS
jgi:hypothetical protein